MAASADPPTEATTSAASEGTLQVDFITVSFRFRARIDPEENGGEGRLIPRRAG
jgi:hypothetical protein